MYEDQAQHVLRDILNACRLLGTVWGLHTAAHRTHCSQDAQQCAVVQRMIWDLSFELQASPSTSLSLRPWHRIHLPVACRCALFPRSVQRPAPLWALRATLQGDR